MKITNRITTTGILALGLLVSSCSGEAGKPEKEEASGEKTEVKEEEEAPSVYGKYTMVDMVPVVGDKKLTPEDTKYINESKTRTVNHTTLQLNEDGTFERIFPNPSGDGTTSKWTGTYKMDLEAKTLNCIAEMEGKKLPIDFTIVEQSDNKLTIRSSFGQIFMDYMYTK